MLPIRFPLFAYLFVFIKIVMPHLFEFCRAIPRKSNAFQFCSSFPSELAVLCKCLCVYTHFPNEAIVVFILRIEGESGHFLSQTFSAVGVLSPSLIEYTNEEKSASLDFPFKVNGITVCWLSSLLKPSACLDKVRIIRLPPLCYLVWHSSLWLTLQMVYTLSILTVLG